MNKEKKPSQEKKPFQYEIPEEKPNTVDEPLIKYETLNLDHSKRYTYADYLTRIIHREANLQFQSRHGVLVGYIFKNSV